MNPNNPVNLIELAQQSSLKELADDKYKIEVKIVPAEDLEEKKARIKRESEDAKVRRWLTLLLVPATFALCAWAVLTGKSVGQSLLTSAVPAILGYLFGKQSQGGHK